MSYSYSYSYGLPSSNHSSSCPGGATPLRDWVGGELGDCQELYFFVVMPFISGLVGYVTNVIALKMTFFPLEFWPIKVCCRHMMGTLV